MEALVSCVLPTFNSEKYVVSALESVYNQTYKNWELIIVDGGSNDRTKDLVNTYKDKRIKFIKRPQHEGDLISCLNFGIAMAKGQYIARMDSDDVCHRERFDYQVKFLSENPAVALVASRAKLINKFGFGFRSIGVFGSDSFIKWRMIFENPIIHPSIMVRRSLFIGSSALQYSSFEGIDEAEDYWLWVQMASFAQFHILKKPLIKFRAHQYNRSKLAKEEVDNATHGIQHFFYHSVLKLKCMKSCKGTTCSSRMQPDACKRIKLLDTSFKEFTKHVVDAKTSDPPVGMTVINDYLFFKNLLVFWVHRTGRNFALLVQNIFSSKNISYYAIKLVKTILFRIVP